MSAGVGCFGSPMPKLIGVNPRARLDALEEHAKLFERIRLKFLEKWIHGVTGKQ